MFMRCGGRGTGGRWEEGGGKGRERKEEEEWGREWEEMDGGKRELGGGKGDAWGVGNGSRGSM